MIDVEVKIGFVIDKNSVGVTRTLVFLVAPVVVSVPLSSISWLKSDLAFVYLGEAEVSLLLYLKLVMLNHLAEVIIVFLCFIAPLDYIVEESICPKIKIPHPEKIVCSRNHINVLADRP